MLISVVIPIYNIDSSYLSRCIHSALQSDYDNIEVVVVDDGSQDNYSREYVNICENESHACYYKKENGGPSAARNYGVDKARGVYVMFLDADDYLTCNCINDAIELCKGLSADIVMGYIYKNTGKGINNELIDLSYDTNEHISVTSETQKAQLLNHILGYTNELFLAHDAYISDGPVARLFKKNLFENNRFDLVPVWNEDTLWNIGIIKSAGKIVVCKSVWYVYDVRLDSVTQGYRDDCVDEFKYITQRVCEAGKVLWEEMADKGIYYRIWHDVFFLGRVKIFHTLNRDGIIKRFRDFRISIESDCYQEAIRKVDFSQEPQISKRLVKKIIRNSMRAHLYLLTFCLIGIYLHRTHI